MQHHDVILNQDIEHRCHAEFLFICREGHEHDEGVPKPMLTPVSVSVPVVITSELAICYKKSNKIHTYLCLLAESVLVFFSKKK